MSSMSPALIFIPRVGEVLTVSDGIGDFRHAGLR